MRHKDIAEVTRVDRKDNDGEKAHGNFERWKVMTHDVRFFIHYRSKLTLSSVVLTQTSSVYVERVFSQWQNITDICGIQQKQKMVQYRMFS